MTATFGVREKPRTGRSHCRRDSRGSRYGYHLLPALYSADHTVWYGKNTTGTNDPDEIPSIDRLQIKSHYDLARALWTQSTSLRCHYRRSLWSHKMKVLTIRQLFSKDQLQSDESKKTRGFREVSIRSEVLP